MGQKRDDDERMFWHKFCFYRKAKGDAMIFNIQRCSIHDGEGLRTLVLLQRMSTEVRLVRKPRISEL